MASNQKIIYVYESFKFTTPNFLGTLFVENVRGRESYSFEYDADWLKSSANYMYLDPDLQLYAGRQYPTGAKNVFGLFADSSPDRWGRLLMTRRERILAEQEGRKPRKLLDSDFLMGVYDETRMGAIRFKLDKDGPFLSDDSETPTPPWTSLRTLEEASRQFENDESGLEQKWINQLIKPGSSLGGARPKATVLDTKGNLWIAKFPSKHDDINVGAWEKVTHDLARLCGLDVPESMLIDFSKYGSTFLVRRFDRNGAARIHFASAMTMLGKTDGASAADGSSYLELVSFIKANGAAPKRDLTELWKRIVFNMAVSNTDDHMRNHGFILKADDMSRQERLEQIQKVIEQREQNTYAATEMTLRRFTSRGDATFHFFYDYGDGWEVVLRLEEVFEDSELPGKELPRVLEGQGFGIIEDCGGPAGLEHLREVFQQKSSPEYQSMREWLGTSEVDLSVFDLQDLNFRLKKLPRIFRDLYEYDYPPTKHSIDLLDRKYCKTN